MQHMILVLCTPHFLMINWLRDCVFEGGNRTHVCNSKNDVVYWRKKSKDNIALSKSTLKTFKQLIRNCYNLKTYKVPNYLLFYKRDYVGFFVLVIFL